MAIENKLIEELQPENQEEEQERIIIYQNQEAIYNDIFKILSHEHLDYHKN